MKKFTKLLGIVLIIALVMSMGTMAFADPTAITTPTDGFTITMKTTTGHTYKAYQVFKGDLAQDGSDVLLSNIDWGDGVDGAALLTALKADSSPVKTLFAACTDAASVAKVLGGTGVTADQVSAFAKIAAANKKGDGATGTTSITGLQPGYYLVVDTTLEANMPEGQTYSDFILEVVKNVDVTAKDTFTTSDKKVKDVNDSEATSTTNPTGWQDSADYDIGDDVPFRLTGTVASDYAKYDTYYFAFHDKQSAGLTFNADSVKVYVGTTEITSGFVVKTSGLTDECTFEVVFADLKQVTGVTAGSVIAVEYTSELNTNAVIGSAGNPNTSHIEFSNNPNDDQHGKTPDDKVVVFTYKTVIDKVDKDGEDLKGADFTLYKEVPQGTTGAQRDPL